MTDIAFKPLTPVKAQDVQAPTKIDTPDYPDKGTTYAGYSKTLYSGNTYQLNPQSQEDVSYGASYAGGETQTGLSNPFLNVKDFYVTKIILGIYHTGALIGGATTTISDGNNVRIRVMEDASVSTDNYDLDFLTPLVFKKENNIILSFSNARNAGDIISITFIGWTE